mmetsp:Transcript_117729/g.375263  ORF Transcript_117729/g.375263 Transcript_117729/m.375263 type:complete len:328 (+) Transcript_117729:2928-3911(+)
MSGNNISMRSVPIAMSISERPCAAPLLSTDPEQRSISNIQGITSPNISSGSPFAKVPKALATVARTSGTGSIRVTFSAGRSEGKYGWMSFGSLMRMTMEPTICAPLRFISAERSFSARCTRGHTSDSEGASTWCTKDVPSSLSRTSLVMCSCWAPSVSAEMSSGARAFNSGLVMMLPTLSMASRAASLTLLCWSLITPQSAGTTCGKQAASCLGMQFVMAARSSMLPNFVRHCLSLMPSKTLGSTCLTPGPLNCFIISLEALEAAVWTSLFGSEKACNSNGVQFAAYGSKSRARLRARPSTQNMAPWRTPWSFLFSLASVILSMMPC